MTAKPNVESSNRSVLLLLRRDCDVFELVRDLRERSVLRESCDERRESVPFWRCLSEFSSAEDIVSSWEFQYSSEGEATRREFNAFQTSQST